MSSQPHTMVSMQALQPPHVHGQLQPYQSKSAPFQKRLCEEGTVPQGQYTSGPPISALDLSNINTNAGDSDSLQGMLKNVNKQLCFDSANSTLTEMRASGPSVRFELDATESRFTSTPEKKHSKSGTKQATEESVRKEPQGGEASQSSNKIAISKSKASGNYLKSTASSKAKSTGPVGSQKNPTSRAGKKEMYNRNKPSSNITQVMSSDNMQQSSATGGHTDYASAERTAGSVAKSKNPAGSGKQDESVDWMFGSVENLLISQMERDQLQVSFIHK